jgi:DNA invertase Pin-like site-specific DNA recombinase
MGSCHSFHGVLSPWGAFIESYVDEGISAKTTNRPAFHRLHRLMQDIKLGRIDTVTFTESSRLSRCLKDFLNIFKLSQRRAGDLVCLKTEIDTISAYQRLVTKILVVFSEFEREMTSPRTAITAYERSKRGLANGGQTLLGYRLSAGIRSTRAACSSMKPRPRLCGRSSRHTRGLLQPDQGPLRG